jgi:hypothetical protein
MPATRLLASSCLILALLALPAAALASEATEDGFDTPVGFDAEEALTPPAAAIPIEPDPNVVDPRPHAWDHIVVGAAGHTLDVVFWMGIEACNGLHSVTVTPTATGVDIALMTGTPPDMPPDTACIEIAQQYVTRVTLDAPLISGAG